MSRRGSLAHMLPELVRTLLARRVTVSFPFEPLEQPVYFRGKVIVQSELCQGCGLCVRDCPAFALELERQEGGRFQLVHYRDRCAYCGQCADSCPQGAIALVSEFVPPTPRRDTLTQVIVERDTDPPRGMKIPKPPT